MFIHIFNIFHCQMLLGGSQKTSKKIKCLKGCMDSWKDGGWQSNINCCMFGVKAADWHFPMIDLIYWKTFKKTLSIRQGHTWNRTVLTYHSMTQQHHLRTSTLFCHVTHHADGVTQLNATHNVCPDGEAEVTVGKYEKVTNLHFMLYPWGDSPKSEASRSS